MSEFARHTAVKFPHSEDGLLNDVWTESQVVQGRVTTKLAEADRSLNKIDLVLDEVESRASLAENLAQEETVGLRYASFLGEVSVKQALDKTPESGVSSGLTLAESIKRAGEGDKDAESRVDISVGTATTEGWFKTGHFTRVKKELSADGEVVQFGLTTENMHRDSVVLRPDRPNKLKEFTLAETRNGYREQELARSGELQNNIFIAASCVPEGLSEKELDHRGDGYFTRSMTFSLQGTTQEGAEIVTETVFDRGTSADELSSYEDRQAERFDIAAIGKVYERLGLPPPKTALEMLQTPIKVPKSLMPNGMADFWRWVDEAADELRGDTIVRTEQEYIDRINLSREREASLADAKIKIKKELMALGSTFEDDMQAVDALWELVRKHGPEEALTNDHIDPIVFGPDAAGMIIQARDFIQKGDQENAKLWIDFAQEVASVSGCGGGSCGIVKLGGLKAQAANELLKAEAGETTAEDTERECVDCGEKAVVYAWDEKDLSKKPKKACMNCGATEGISNNKPASEETVQSLSDLIVSSISSKNKPKTGLPLAA